MADHTITNASLAEIYNRLNKAPQYHPLEADTFADWSIEAGDVVTVSRENDNYTSPVYSNAMTWRRGQQITVSSTGNKERESIAKVSQQKYVGGGGGIGGGAGLRNDKFLHYFVEDSYAQMKAGLIITASSLSAYVNSKYDQMSSGLELTASSAALYVNSKYDQMTAGLQLTASSAALYVNSKYDQMTSGLFLTSSSLSAYVKNSYERLQSGLEVTASSAALYARSESSAASVTAKINKDGSSGVYINADKIKLNGKTSISLMLTGKALISKLTVTSVDADSITVRPVAGMGAINVATAYNGSTFVYDETTKEYKLTLAKMNGNFDEYTFSRATTLTDSWSSGTYTVMASPQGDTKSTTLQSIDADTSDSVHRSGKNVYRNYIVKYGPNSSMTQSTGFKQAVTINASSVYDQGWGNARLCFTSPLTEPTTFTDHIDITYPPTPVDGSALTRSYYVSADSSYAYITINSTKVARVAITGGHNTSHSGGIWDSTFYNHPQHGVTEKTEMYCYINGSLAMVGNKYWYYRDTYMGPQTVYT